MLIVVSSPGFATLILFKEAFVFVDVFSKKIYTGVITSPLSRLWCLSNPCRSVLGRSVFLPGSDIFFLALGVFLLGVCDLAAALRILLFGLCDFPFGLGVFLACLSNFSAPFAGCFALLQI